MHIVYLCEEYPPNMFGGIGIFVQTLGRELVNRGHRVTVLGPWTRAGTRYDNGVEIREFQPSEVLKVGWWLTRRRWRAELARLHSEHPIDVLEAMDWQGFLFGVHSALPSHLPRVVRLQGSQIFFSHALGRRLSRPAAFIEGKSLEAAGHLVGITKFAYTTLVALLPHLSSKPYSIIPNPVDTEIFHPKLNQRTEPGLVMFVGTLTAKKGIGELIAGWPEVLRSFPDARLELVAKDTIDPLTGKKWSEQIFERLPVELHRTCRWLGAQDHDHLPEIMSRASICVFPSHMETQAIVACEAMALGKPIVFTKKGPGPEIVVDGESGLLVDPLDHKEISTAIVRLLKDSSLRARLGVSARSRAESHFSLNAIAERNANLYRQLSQGFGSSGTSHGKRGILG